MTVSSATNRVAYSGNGSTTAFSFPYFVLASTDLSVYEVDTTTKAISSKVLTTDWTWSGTAADDGTYPFGGTVNANSAPASGKKWVIFANPPNTQSTHWVDGDGDPAAVKELAFDKLTLLVRWARDILSRVIRMPDGMYDSFDPTLPVDAALNPGATIAVNATGDGLAWGATTTDIAAAQANAAAAAASATAAASSQSAAAASATAAATSATNAATSETNAAASATAAASSASSINTISGTFASPNLVAAAGQIPITAGALRQTVYVKGNGGAVTCGGAYIQAGTIDGQEVEVVGTDGTNTVTIPDGGGTGTRSNGDVTLGADSRIRYRWDTVKWVESMRNGI